MNQKYITLLKLMDDVIATKDAIKPAEGWAWQKNHPGLQPDAFRIPHPCHAVFDILLAYIDTEFALTKPFAESRKEFVSFVGLGYDYDTTVRAVPSTISENIFPLLCIKCILVQHRMPIEPILLDNFDNFHKKYGRLIIGDN